ncbi:MAG: hypothetical protein NC541_04305 [bacterium]|nr:hypothetical protein [bacterium]
MRKFEKGTEKKITQVVCNMCGRELKLEDGCLREGCFSGEAAFGYFSRKDGTLQRFDLCEDCYDEMTARFRIPAETAEDPELVWEV